MKRMETCFRLTVAECKCYGSLNERTGLILHRTEAVVMGCWKKIISSDYAVIIRSFVCLFRCSIASS